MSDWLATEGGRPLRVTRRDAEDLVLMTAARADQEHEVVSAAAAVLRALLASGETGVFRGALPAAFAWAQLLSDAEVDQFAAELADSLSVGASLGNPAPSALTIEAWRHTAEVYADPDRRSRHRCPRRCGDGAVAVRSHRRRPNLVPGRRLSPHPMAETRQYRTSEDH